MGWTHKQDTDDTRQQIRKKAKKRAPSSEKQGTEQKWGGNEVT